MRHSFQKIPTPTKFFGIAGLLPFFAGAILCWTQVDSFPFSGVFILSAYGAVILSFLGGIRWGVAMQHATMMNRWPVVAWAMVPSLLAWAALLLNPSYGLLLLLFGFVLQFLIDLRSVRNGLTPDWFASLRLLLTIGACISLFAGWLGTQFLDV